MKLLKLLNSDLPFWYALFCVASVGMQLLNKAIATSFREIGITSLDNALMAWQQLAAITLNFACMATIGGDVWAMKPVTSAQVYRLVLPTVNFVLMLLCSLKALKTVHVATVVVARNLCTVFVCVGEATLLRQPVSGRVLFCLLVILIGSLVYGFSDLSFEQEGYAWQGANSLLFIVGQLYEKWAMSKSTDQTALGVSTLKNTLSLPVLGALGALQGDWRIDGIDLVPQRTWVLIVMTGAGCCMLSICYMTLYKTSSATAVTVGGNFNKVVSIVLGALMFNAPLGLVQTLGLLICIAGSLAYSLESLRDWDDTVAEKKAE